MSCEGQFLIPPKPFVIIKSTHIIYKYVTKSVTSMRNLNYFEERHNELLLVSTNVKLREEFSLSFKQLHNTLGKTFFDTLQKVALPRLIKDALEKFFIIENEKKKKKFRTQDNIGAQYGDFKTNLSNRLKLGYLIFQYNKKNVALKIFHCLRNVSFLFSLSLQPREIPYNILDNLLQTLEKRFLVFIHVP